MFCLKCGALNDDDARFCTECGQPLVGTPSDTEWESPTNSNQPMAATPATQYSQPAWPSQNTTTQYQNNQSPPYAPTYPPASSAYPPAAVGGYQEWQGETPAVAYGDQQGIRKSGGAMIVAGITAFAVIALIAAGVTMFVKNSDSQNDDAETSDVSSVAPDGDNADTGAGADDDDEGESQTSNTLDQDAVDAIVDGYSTTDAAVSVMTSDGVRSYSSRNADSEFVASGLYLPIYLAYEDLHDGQISDSAKEMMSQMSNDAANDLIDTIGGFDELNDWLSDNQYTGTSFEREFGDVEASGDGYENYTSSDDAARMLSECISNGSYQQMNYDIVSEGVTVPDGATVYAHRGTGIQDAYNYFVVISDGNDVVGVSVMTENLGKEQAAGLTSDILENVWDTMFEGR